MASHFCRRSKAKQSARTRIWYSKVSWLDQFDMYVVPAPIQIFRNSGEALSKERFAQGRLIVVIRLLTDLDCFRAMLKQRWQKLVRHFQLLRPRVTEIGRKSGDQSLDLIRVGRLKSISLTFKILGISSNNSEKTAEPETHEQRPLDESNIGIRILLPLVVFNHLRKSNVEIDGMGRARTWEEPTRNCQPYNGRTKSAGCWVRSKWIQGDVRVEKRENAANYDISIQQHPWLIIVCVNVVSVNE